MDEPAVRAVVEDWIDRIERRWCDEPVPALSGMTPRQAAADPTRRETLDRLLGASRTGAARLPEAACR